MSRIDQIEAGYYRTKLVRGGPWCAVCIWYGAPADPETGELLDRSPRWQALVNGNEWADPDGLWVYVSDKRIDLAEYEYLLATSRHAKVWDRSAPEATPEKTADLTRYKPIF